MVEEGAVNIGGQQADGWIGHDRFYHRLICLKFASVLGLRAVTQGTWELVFHMLYFSDHAMGMFNLWYPWGLLLQVAAIIHFIRRRPDTYWLWIILIVPFGAIIYLMVEAAPDIGLLGGAFRVFPRRRRIRELEAMIRDNPSAGNYEELADLYMQDGNYAKGRDCYNHAISSRTDSPDPFYRRAVCAIELKDFAPAVPDLERVVASKAVLKPI